MTQSALITTKKYKHKAKFDPCKAGMGQLKQ